MCLTLFSSRMRVSVFKQVSTPSNSRGRWRGKSTKEKRVWSGKANVRGGCSLGDNTSTCEQTFHQTQPIISIWVIQTLNYVSGLKLLIHVISILLSNGKLRNKSLLADIWADTLSINNFLRKVPFFFQQKVPFFNIFWNVGIF